MDIICKRMFYLLQTGDSTTEDRNAPLDLKFDDVIVDLCFHPSQDTVAVGHIDGDVTV